MLHVATGTLHCFQKQFRAVDRFVSPESYSYRAKVLCQAARLLRWTLSFGLFVVTLCSSGPLLSTRISAGAVRSITLSRQHLIERMTSLYGRLGSREHPFGEMVAGVFSKPLPHFAHLSTGIN